MRKAGYLVITSDSGTTENDTFGCAHCNSVVIVTTGRPAEESGGWCLHCSKCICKGCATLGRCTPFEKKLDRYEKRAAMLRSMGV
jgi:hypothetical protein